MGSICSVEQSQRRGGSRPTIPLDVRPRVWYNEDLDSRNYLIPGLIAVIMMVISAMLTSLTVAREWERGTMEQLISTPVKISELIIGKLVPYFVVGAIGVVLAMAMGEFVFHVPLRGSVALVLGTSAMFLVGSLAMGILISIVTKNQLLANQLAGVATFLPAFLLSGFIYNISNMPQAIQWVTYLVPARYFVALLKGDLSEGSGRGNSRRPDRAAGDFRRRDAAGGPLDLPQEAGIAMFERIKQMLIKEFIQVFRDPRMLIVIFLIPCVQVLVIGYAVTFDVKHVRTAVYDLDNSQVSRELTARFIRSGYFDVVATIGDDQSARDLLDRGDVTAAGAFQPRVRRQTCAAAGRPNCKFWSTAPTRTRPASP